MYAPRNRTFCWCMSRWETFGVRSPYYFVTFHVFTWLKIKTEEERARRRAGFLFAFSKLLGLMSMTCICDIPKRGIVAIAYFIATTLRKKKKVYNDWSQFLLANDKQYLHQSRWGRETRGGITKDHVRPCVREKKRFLQPEHLKVRSLSRQLPRVSAALKKGDCGARVTQERGGVKHSANEETWRVRQHAQTKKSTRNRFKPERKIDDFDRSLRCRKSIFS